MSYQAVLFDLDGTLLDTAPDIGAALNIVLKTKNLPPLQLDLIRPHAGRGYKGLLEIGLGIDETHPDYPALLTELANHYATTMLNTTDLFDGMSEILNYLEHNHIPWGIVTNKPQRFTDPIIKKLNLDSRTNCIVSGDTLSKSKPHPEPILYACELLKADPKQCLYVGDSKIDVLACKAAGTDALVALYGYIPEGESPLSWDAQGYISHPSEILSWV